MRDRHYQAKNIFLFVILFLMSTLINFDSVFSRHNSAVNEMVSSDSGDFIQFYPVRSNTADHNNDDEEQENDLVTKLNCSDSLKSLKSYKHSVLLGLHFHYQNSFFPQLFRPPIS